MIQSHIGHLEFRIDPKNKDFYKNLFSFLGWSTLYEEPGVIGVGDSKETSLWFTGVTKPVANDYDGPGLNHLGLAADSVADVDATVNWLKEQGVSSLFNTPCHRPEFSSPGNTYYQVMFETPDRILLEVVYTGTMQE